jgi:hypothetical protein
MNFLQKVKGMKTKMVATGMFTVHVAAKVTHVTPAIKGATRRPPLDCRGVCLLAPVA